MENAIVDSTFKIFQIQNDKLFNVTPCLSFTFGKTQRK